MWIQIVLGSALGVFLTFIINVIYEKRKMPKLILKCADKPHEDADYSKESPARHARFLGVDLINESPSPVAQRFFMRHTAENCTGHITFQDEQGDPLFSTILMPIRWASSTDFALCVTTEDGQRSWWIMSSPAEKTVNLAPGNSGRIVIAAKFDDDTECYGWTRDNLVKGWRNPDWKISKEKCKATVFIDSGGRQIKKQFTVINPGTRKQFTLKT